MAPQGQTGRQCKKAFQTFKIINSITEPHQKKKHKHTQASSAHLSSLFSLSVPEEQVLRASGTERFIMKKESEKERAPRCGKKKV